MTKHIFFAHNHQARIWQRKTTVESKPFWRYILLALIILWLSSCQVSRYTMLQSDLKVQTMPHRLIKVDTIEVFTLVGRDGKDSLKGHRLITTFTQKGGMMRNLTIKEREYLMRSNSVEDYEKRLIKLKAYQQ